MRPTFFAAAALYLAGSPALPATPPPPADVIDTAVAAGTFQTLAQALGAAGLIETLKGPGPFTVFAPTDEAFARLPAGTLEGLLAPARRSELRTILTYHVVAGRVLSTDLLRVGQAASIAGPSLTFGLRVGPANVVKADIPCSNGVIHVIDAVLIPPSPPAALHASAPDAIREAIRRGAPLYNSGDPAGCAALYEACARAVLAMDEAALGPIRRADLERTLARSGREPSDRAWDLRHAFDRILADAEFEPRMEAALPAGFPSPGPVGIVVEKSYPACRAARAQGGESFWTLFRHIQSRQVAMTAPVQMSLDDDLRAVDMAFLYPSTAEGQAGADGRVEVLDLPATTVLSIGMRGDDDAPAVAQARAALEARLAAGGYRRAGEFRRMGYNSPMVPAARRFWELQVPVRR
jgi:hypothetical protein